MEKHSRRVKLRDIATRAGVSVNTVSRALRNKPDVGEKTRETIFRLAEELGYTFLETAALKNKNLVIGVLIQDILNPFFAKVVQEIESVLWQHRANFLFECSYRQESKERDIIAFFSRQAVDGLIVSSVIDPDSILSQIQHSQIPTVFLSQRFEQYDVDYVINDNYEGGLVATEHLLHLGHTRIAYIADFDSQSSAHERFRGYQTAHRQANVPTDDRLLRSGDKTIESGYYLMKDLLQSAPPLTAVFTHNDLVALGAFRAIKEAGLKIPADISLVGYDDILFTDFFDIPLTTVHQPIVEISQKAMDLLFEKINAGPRHVPQQIILKPRLTVRGSTSICST